MRFVLIAVLCGPLYSQPALTSLRLAGSATHQGDTLRLTPAETWKVGAAWYPEKQRVGDGFDTKFEFHLTGQGGAGHGADGFAFVLQNSGPDAIAGRGASGGFALGDGHGDLTSPGIPRSIAVFFDTFRNEELGDPSGNYVSLCTNGKLPSMRWPPPRLAFVHRLKSHLKDGAVHSARVVYQPPILSVFVDNAPKPVLTSAVDLSTVVDTDGSTYLGFTASTGDGYENHDILSWSFAPAPKPDVSSTISFDSSSVSTQGMACLADRNLCTPEHASVEETGPGRYHIVLPANLEWAASIPNPRRRRVETTNARGFICWDAARGALGCGGPSATTLITRTRRGRTEFSVNKRLGGFVAGYQGYFEFDAKLNE